MCQLLGMNCASPTDFSFSLRGFCVRGGETDVHAHGFGLVLYQGRGIQCFHDVLPACKSPIAQLVQSCPMRTLNMMAHIRYATQGEVSLENVHPFSRVWKGVQMCFCHNGEVPKFSNLCCASTLLLGKTTPNDVIYLPVGDTDSEAVFCAILNALQCEFKGGLPTLSVLHDFLSMLCDEIIADRPDTIFNFLMGCGENTLFAYSWPGSRPGSTVWNGLFYIVREPPFATAKLLDVDYEIDFAKFATIDDRVAIITTKPLTEEPGWTEFKRGELLMFDKGKPYCTPKSCEAVENEGRGLHSRFITEPKCHKSPRLRPVQPMNLPPPCAVERISAAAAVVCPSTRTLLSPGVPPKDVASCMRIL
jgi:predicted glutamine amidotransferase